MKQKNNPVVNSAKKVGDTVVLLITISLLILAMLFAYRANEIIELVYVALFVLGFSLLFIRIWQISYLGNALRIQNGQHAHLLEKVRRISRDLQMPYVDVYITQDPFLNAFAMGYTRPFTIVLNSATVEELSEQELEAILVHEMGHIKFKHTIISSYLYPMVTLVPVLGQVISWAFGFWSRRAELACDRLAVAYTRDPHIVCNALIKVHVGSKFADYIKEEGILFQGKIGRGYMRLFAQSFSTHPYLVNRIKAVLDFSRELNMQTPALDQSLTQAGALAQTPVLQAQETQVEPGSFN